MSAQLGRTFYRVVRPNETTFRDWVSDLSASNFGQALLIELIGGVVAGAVVAVVVAYLLDRRAREAEELGLVERVLVEVERELEHNAEQAEALIAHLPREPPEIPYPLFDVNGWTVLTQAVVLKAISADTLALLMKTYNRFRTSNEQHAFVHSLLAGPEWVTANVLVAVHGTSDQLAGFETVRAGQISGLVDRVQELQKVLPDTRAAVRSDLDAIRIRRAK